MKKIKYEKPRIISRKITAQFLSFPNKIKLKDGINNFFAADDLLLAACCGTCCGGGCSCVSDVRFKEKIIPLTDVLEKIQKLSCINFKWNRKLVKKTLSQQSNIGLIAQEVEHAFPDLVVPIQGIKTVNYNGVIAVLVQAVKELHDQNKQLKQLINDKIMLLH